MNESDKVNVEGGLTDQQARSLYLESERNKRIGGAYQAKWPSKLDNKRILQAGKAGHNQVVLSSDRVFNIRHTDGKMIWISPISGGFVPCGWFDLEKMQKELEESEVT